MLSFYDYSTIVTPVINPLAIVMLASYPLVAPSFATGYIPSADAFGVRYPASFEKLLTFTPARSAT